jgi:hypothetical protein
VPTDRRVKLPALRHFVDAETGETELRAALRESIAARRDSGESR